MAPFEGPHVLGPEPKVLQNGVRAIRQADGMAGSSVTFFTEAQGEQDKQESDFINQENSV